MSDAFQPDAAYAFILIVFAAVVVLCVLDGLKEHDERTSRQGRQGPPDER